MKYLICCQRNIFKDPYIYIYICEELINFSFYFFFLSCLVASSENSLHYKPDITVIILTSYTLEYTNDLGLLIVIHNQNIQFSNL